MVRFGEWRSLDGEPVHIIAFILDNDLGEEGVDQIKALNVGCEIIYGGGAAPEFVLRREV